MKTDEKELARILNKARIFHSYDAGPDPLFVAADPRSYQPSPPNAPPVFGQRPDPAPIARTVPAPRVWLRMLLYVALFAAFGLLSLVVVATVWP